MSKFILSLALKAEHSAVEVLCSSNDSAHSPPLKQALGEGTSWNDLLLKLCPEFPNSKNPEIRARELEHKWTISRYPQNWDPGSSEPTRGLGHLRGNTVQQKIIETLCHLAWKSMTLGNSWISKQVLYQNSAFNGAWDHYEVVKCWNQVFLFWQKYSMWSVMLQDGVRAADHFYLCKSLGASFRWLKAFPLKVGESWHPGLSSCESGVWRQQFPIMS